MNEGFSAAKSSVQYGHMVRVKEYPCLYYYELSHGYVVKERRYCIPVVDRNGKLKIISGATSEEAIERYKNSHVGVRVGKLNRKSAAEILNKKRGVLKPEVWGLSMFVNLGEFDPEESDNARFAENTKEMLRALMG